MKNFNEKYIIRDFIDKNKWSNVYKCINKETNEKVILNVLINFTFSPNPEYILLSPSEYIISFMFQYNFLTFTIFIFYLLAQHLYMYLLQIL